MIIKAKVPKDWKDSSEQMQARFEEIMELQKTAVPVAVVTIEHNWDIPQVVKFDYPGQWVEIRHADESLLIAWLVEYTLVSGFLLLTQYDEAENRTRYLLKWERKSE